MSRLVVCDCSVTSAWFLPDEASEKAEKILNEIMQSKTTLLLPSLWWYETCDVLRSSVRQKRITDLQATQTLLFLREIPVDFVTPDSEGLYGILSTSLDNNLSAYDASYVYLARSAGAELITADEGICALRRKLSFVKHLSDY